MNKTYLKLGAAVIIGMYIAVKMPQIAAKLPGA